MKNYYLKFSFFFLIVTFIITPFIISSCSVQRVSNVITKNIQPGMTKNQVVTLLGSPYKNALQKNESGKQMETLYYKEQLWVGGTHRLIESILTFEEGKLISINQGKETDPYSPTVTVH